MKLPVIKVTGKLPTHSQYKRPKNLGAIVDLYEQVTELRKLASTIHDALDAVANAIIDDYKEVVKEQKLSGVSGKNKHLALNEKEVLVYDSDKGGREKFMKWVLANKKFHLLNTSFSKSAVKEELLLLNKNRKPGKEVKVLPGLTIMKVKKPSLTNLKGKK